MKSSFALVVFLLAVSAPASAQTPGRIRPVDSFAAETVERAIAGSQLVRELVAELEATDVIVHVETTTVLPPATAGLTRFVSKTVNHRYVRVTLDRALLPDYRAALLGHELQHVCEIARAGVTDLHTLRRLLEAIGHRVPGSTRSYETHAAIAATRRVWQELRRAERVRDVGPQPAAERTRSESPEPHQR